MSEAEKNVLPKVLHPGRLVHINVFANVPDPSSPSGRSFRTENIYCYDTTMQDVMKAIMDSLLSKGFVSADELRPDWKDRISQ